VVAGAPDLGIDEAVDGFMADGGTVRLARHAAGDLLGRPALGEVAEHEAAQRRVAFELRSGPAAGLRLLMGVARLVADLGAMVALQLSRDRRWRAIQSCRDLPDRLPVFAKTGNRASLVQREMFIMFAHANTLDRCCTSFVNSEDPSCR